MTSETTLTADYLIIGAGAMGMAFADALMNETDATIVLVDRHGRPGGHWNDAYPFVRLHQPSAFYGVNSRPLGSDTIDATGWNAGLYELASASEILAYYDHVMHQDFLPSGRVQYFPMCNYTGDGTFHSTVSGQTWTVEATRVVDATYMNVTVPSVSGPNYEVADDAICIPLNGLPDVATPPEGYVIVGAGKTGMDAVLWLLKSGVDPAKIRWVMPRDSWMWDRAAIQPGTDSQVGALTWMSNQMEVSATAATLDELFLALEERGNLMRVDPEVTPTMWRCATVSVAELEQLRRVTNIIRMGRVQRITADEIVLDEGTVATSPGTVHVDCSSDGLATRPAVPVFDGDRITLQAVRTCQQVFSAAFIAHVEASYDDEAQKNTLCGVIPHPDTREDWLRVTMSNGMNSAVWAGDEELTAWLAAARLDAFSITRTGDGNPEEMALLQRIEANAMDAMVNLQRLAAAAAPAGQS